MVVIFFISMALPFVRDLNFNECLILMKIKWRKLRKRNDRIGRHKNTARSFPVSNS